MKNIFLLLLFVVSLSSNLLAQEREMDKINEVIEVLEALPQEGAYDIPDDLLDTAEAIIIIPMLRKGGLIVGGKFGKGVAIIKNESGEWSDPAFLKMTGGSIGLQIGYTSSDLLLVFKKAKTLKRLTTGKGKFTLGGDVTVASGPEGQSNATMNTDLDFKAEIYSYAIHRGVFAGVSIAGAELKIDDKANKNYYGDKDTGRQIIREASSGVKSSELLLELKEKLKSF